MFSTTVSNKTIFAIFFPTSSIQPNSSYFSTRCLNIFIKIQPFSWLPGLLSTVLQIDQSSFIWASILVKQK